MQVLAANSKLVASCHLVGGLLCLFNIIFNYVECVRTDPGSTEVLDKPVSALSPGQPVIRPAKKYCCRLHNDLLDSCSQPKQGVTA